MKTKRGFVGPDYDEHLAIIETSASTLPVCYEFVKRFDVAVQAGGNIGIWPQIMSERFALVHTFEPLPENLDFLRMNCTAPNIVIHAQALGDVACSVGMARVEKNCGASYIDGSGAIEVVRLDDLCLSGLDFLMLDIEGYELKAIRGAKETIDAYSPVICTEVKGLGDKYGDTAADLYDFMASLGYRRVKRSLSDLIWTR